MTYGLPDDYQARLEPQYFNDTLPDSIYWQSDVYRAAAMLARKADVKRIVDIGCGRGGKLMPLALDFKIAGIDYGVNIDYCREVAPAGEWYDIDLNTEVVSAELFKDSVTICADIIEHLPTPDALIHTLWNTWTTAAYVLVSTPDRERLQQGTEKGMPANPSHCREWTEREFCAWLQSEGLPIVWHGWTTSFDKQRDKLNTILVILSKTKVINDFPLAFEKAKYDIIK